MSFAKTVSITDRGDWCEPGWEFHRIRTMSSIDDYNRFVLKGLIDHIDTDFVLVAQFDGFIVSPDLWSDDFLEYDYIGAVWPNSPAYPVGNGGFSLRSRKLLKALTDDRIGLFPEPHGEDEYICRYYRSYLETRHGIRFAPVEVAERFSVESGRIRPTFGFHGLYLLDNFYKGADALYLFDNLQPYIFKKSDTVLLGTRYARAGLVAEAAACFAKLGQYSSLEAAQRNYAGIGGDPAYIAECWQRFVGA
jgi:hypothetical protein